jgi:hypothetical protein
MFWEFVHPNPDQSWFWTDEWQEAEREAEEDLAAGRYDEFYTADEFVASLEDMASQEAVDG